MKLIPYKAALAMGKEKLNEALAGARVRKARKQAELEISGLEEQIAEKEIQLQEACAQEKLNFESIIDLQDDIGILERKKGQFKTIVEEMFPIETEEADTTEVAE